MIYRQNNVPSQWFRASWIVCALAVDALWGNTAIAASAAGGVNTQIDAWLTYIAALNRPVLAEPAGAHGSAGTAIGLGTSLAAPNADLGPVAAAELNGTATAGSETALARAWVIKGTPWPVDLAASVGAAPDASMTTISGHAQWTIFEAMGWPAVTARLGYAQMMGLRTTKISSAAAEIVVGYGFLRYFDFYLTAGVVRNAATFDAVKSEPGSEGLSLVFDAAESNELHRDRTWAEGIRRAGLRIAVLPPFVAVTVEAGFEGQGGGASEIAAKLSVGM